MEDAIIGSRRLEEQLAQWAVLYAQERHWEVVQGTWLVEAARDTRCSCGDRNCRAPGAHPERADWATWATGSSTGVRRMWAERPRASILLPTGHTFDVIDVPELAGCLALARMERMGITLGPVATAPNGRMLFFVLPGATTKIPVLLRRLGWSPEGLGLVCRGEGDYVVAPPTRIGVTGRAAQWARPPTTDNRWLPEAEELLSPIAYACSRDLPR